jgi:hypothetical protein
MHRFLVLFTSLHLFILPALPDNCFALHILQIPARRAFFFPVSYRACACFRYVPVAYRALAQPSAAQPRLVSGIILHNRVVARETLFVLPLCLFALSPFQKRGELFCSH